MLLIMPLFVVPAYPKQDIHYLQKICSLTDEEPYYDCSENWFLAFSNSTWIVTPAKKYVSGWSVHENLVDRYPICEAYVGFEERFGEEYCDSPYFGFGNSKLDSCWDDKCISLIWHEIKHMKCNCNWHEDMKNDPNRGMNIF